MKFTLCSFALVAAFFASYILAQDDPPNPGFPPCDICGEGLGLVPLNADGELDFSAFGFGVFQCSVLYQSALNGFLDPSFCGFLSGQAQAICQCGEAVGPNTTAPVAATSAPTPVPTASPTVASTPDPTAASTDAPTDAPITSAPVVAPVTPAPVTLAPITFAPVTPAPVTPAPVTPPPTLAPVEAPVEAPVTSAPVTSAPVTSAPITPVPTPAPVMAPVTPAPVTSAPVTPAPVPAVAPIVFPVCYVCGEGFEVTLPDVTIQLGDTIETCARIQLGGLASLISPEACGLLPDSLFEPCGCMESPETPSTTAPVTSAPVTPAPVTSAPVTSAPVEPDTFPSCNICGVGIVTLPDALLLFDADEGPVSCAEFSVSGLNGELTPAFCANIPSVIARACGCMVGDVVEPTPAPVTPVPVTPAPTGAPITSAPVGKKGMGKGKGGKRVRSLEGSVTRVSSKKGVFRGM